ncbi:MAG: sulfotransferase family 2 domain-containing protein [Litoreibacter sp.]
MRFADTKDSLVYIHIGKCGGASLWQAIQDSDQLRTQFNKFVRVHVTKPPILKKARYIIVIRNPIKRAISAFNWRYKLVVNEGEQKNRYPGEYAILRKYTTLNNLAENLYVDGELDPTVAQEFRKIHHFKQDISFYLNDLLKVVRKEQIHYVLATETLNEDAEKLLGVTQMAKEHEHANKVADANKNLSDLAYANLKRFLTDDYRAIETLLDLNSSTATSKNVLLK